jgi:acetylornithine deacetylase
VKGAGTARSLVLNTHLDVVPPGERSAWSHDPYAAEIRDGRLYGRGAMDDKAGVTISLAVLECLAQAPQPLPGDVVFHYVLEDELTGNGSLLCLEAGHGGDAAVIIDGTRLDRAIDEHAGSMQFSIEIRGKPASVSVSHVAVNAAELMSALVLRLRDAVTALNVTAQPPWTQFPSPFQVAVQRLHSIGEQLTTPARADAELWLTFPPPHSLADMRALVTDVVAAFAAETQLDRPPALSWRGYATEPVGSDAAELADALRASAVAVGLPGVDVGPSTGGSDLRHFVARDIPCLLYGPGRGYNPHRPDEHFLLEDLPTMVRLFLDLCERWCV